MRGNPFPQKDNPFQINTFIPLPQIPLCSEVKVKVDFQNSNYLKRGVKVIPCFPSKHK